MKKLTIIKKKNTFVVIRFVAVLNYQVLTLLAFKAIYFPKSKHITQLKNLWIKESEGFVLSVLNVGKQSVI